MPVPTSMSGLFVTDAANSPAGTEAIGSNLDNYIRATAMILKRESAKGADVASATTINVGDDGNYFIVTGAVTITGIAAEWVGRKIYLRFAGAPQLTHNAASFILPGGANIAAAAGDVGIFVEETAGNWRCIAYERAAELFDRVIPQGRLTLTTLLPVTIADVSGVTNVFYAPYLGNLIPIFNGTSWKVFSFSQLTLALATAGTNFQAANTNYDFFVKLRSGAPGLVTGPAWTSDTARGAGAGTTQISRLDGVLTNTVSQTVRFGSALGNTETMAVNQGTYVGTFRPLVDGQAVDTIVNRMIWNNYNRVIRWMGRAEPPATWAYSTDAYRQMNANTANQFAFVRGADEDTVHMSVIMGVNNSTATERITRVAIGLDSATAIANGSLTSRIFAAGNTLRQGTAVYNALPGLGYHFLAALERGNGTDIQTWGSGDGVADQFGLSGHVTG